jgi:signal transduction histidine kinase
MAATQVKARAGALAGSLAGSLAEAQPSRLAATRDAGAGAALERIAAAGWKRGGCSALLALLAAGFAWRYHHHAWLCLFGAFIVVCQGGQAGLLLARRLPGPLRTGSWLPAWAMLAFGLLAGAGGGYALAQGGARAWGIETVEGSRLFGSLLVFGALVLALPLAYAQRQARALHLLALEQAALAAELHSLQAQVEPHFLYNTLANARYLARHDPAQAVRMLDHLIAYLRTSLPDLRAPMSTLGRECELAEHYLALMRIRFGERLDFDVACPEPLLHLPVPPLMLMSLVENAVRHGVEPKPGPVSVRLHAAMDGGRLAVTVSDDGAGLGAAVLGSGVGLRNLRQRLAALYGAGASVELQACGDGWTRSVLSLPVDGGVS